MLRDFEHKLWELDQRINQRGFKADLALAKKATILCAREKLELDRRVSHMTRGTVTSGTQVQKIREFLASEGVNLPDLKANTVDLALQGDTLQGKGRAVLEARARVAKSSTSKFHTLLNAASLDGRLRGGVQYCGASRTGRWAGRLFQPHNLPRSPLKPDEIETAVRAIKNGSAELLTDNVHELCSNVARSVIISEKGKQLLVCDYSAIEGRVLSWLCNERWKLKAYADGTDMYIETFRRTFGYGSDYKIKGDDRQTGKVLELAFQYGGGVNAELNACDTYRADPKNIAQGAWKVASRAVRRQADFNYGLAIKRGDPTVQHMSKRLWVRLESAKIMWRESSPATVKLWSNYEDAARAAIANPGRSFRAGRCTFFMRAGVLAIRLPNGRLLMYYNAHLKKRKQGKAEILYASAYGGYEKLYGGKIAENVTQAVARDILAYAMLKVDGLGFFIILHVHDEIVCEQDINDDYYTFELLRETMCKKPAWATGLPLTAEGFVSTRYRKD